MTVYLADEAATIEFGRRLLLGMPDELAGWTVVFSGELGSGKSTLARAMIRAAGHEGPVPSPTYTLVEPYELSRGTIYHIDLYRISDENELRFLGWDELGDGLCLVEWPERVPGLAEQADIAITLAYDGSGRKASLGASSSRGKGVIATVGMC